MRIRFFLVFSLILSFIGVASADTLTVCSSGCDYVTDGVDDQVEINQAIEDASPGDTIYLSDSTYHVEGSGTYKYNDYKWDGRCGDPFSIVVNHKSDIIIKGAGKTVTTIEMNDPCDGDDAILFINESDNITIRDLKLDTKTYSHSCGIGGGSKENCPGTDCCPSVYAGGPANIFSASVSNLTIENVYLRCGGTALTAYHADDFILRNSTLISDDHNGLRPIGTGPKSVNGLVENCEITAPTFALRAEGNVDYYTYRNNYFHDSQWVELYAWGHHTTFVGNRVENVIYGLAFVNTGDHNWIENNVFEDCRYYGIYLYDRGYNYKNYTIKNNIIYGVSDEKDSRGMGIGIVSGDDGSTFEDITIDGNTIYDSHKGIGTANVYDSTGSGTIDVYNNIISNCEYGLYKEDPTVMDITFNNTYNDINGCTNDYEGGVGEGEGEFDADPLFNSTTDKDFHLKSTVGRYYEGSWVTDAVNSPCIDAGTGRYSNEPDYPNGSRNMGAYGNTIYASKGGDIFPPASITDLTNSTYNQTYINWTWTNPHDADFNYTMVYVNGVFEINTSKAYYNDTGLTNGTNYTISTHTADTSGNLNSTWTNATSTTKSHKSIMDLIRKPHFVGLGFTIALATVFFTARLRRRRSR